MKQLVSKLSERATLRNLELWGSLNQRYENHVETLGTLIIPQEVLLEGLHPLSLVDSFLLHTQEMEGANNTIQHIADAAPTAKLPLVSSRFSILQAVNACIASLAEQQGRWSRQLRPIAVRQVAAQCLEHLDYDKLQSQKQDRWLDATFASLDRAVQEAISKADRKATPCRVSSYPAAAVKSAAWWQGNWHRDYKYIDATTSAFALVTEDGEIHGNLWVCFSKFYSTGCLIKCSLETGGRLATIKAMLLLFMSLHSLFL